MGHGQAGAPVQARDNVMVDLTFADGSVGTVAYVADGSPRVAKERLEAFCGKRTAVLGDYRELELFDERSKDSKKARSQDKGHNEELRRFVEGVRRAATRAARGGGQREPRDGCGSSSRCAPAARSGSRRSSRRRRLGVPHRRSRSGTRSATCGRCWRSARS